MLGPNQTIRKPSQVWKGHAKNWWWTGVLTMGGQTGSPVHAISVLQPWQPNQRINYSRTSLIRTLKRQVQLSTFQRRSYYRGRDYTKFGIFRTRRTDCSREVSVGRSSHCTDHNLCRLCDHSCGWPNGDRNQGTEWCDIASHVKLFNPFWHVLLLTWRFFRGTL